MFSDYRLTNAELQEALGVASKHSKEFAKYSFGKEHWDKHLKELLQEQLIRLKGHTEE